MGLKQKYDIPGLLTLFFDVEQLHLVIYSPSGN